MTLYWNRYLEKIDFLVHEALILNVRWSIEIIRAQRNEPLCYISVALSNNKVSFLSKFSVKNYGPNFIIIIRI